MLDGQVQQLGKHRLVELIAVIVRMQTNAGHPVVFRAAAKILLPVGKHGVARAEGNQLHGTLLAADLG